jgi:hypothetical protein
VQQLSPRFGASNDALAALVRQDQDLTASWRDRDKALVQALSKPEGTNAAQIDSIRRQMADTERKLAATAAQLQKEFPDYAALAPRRCRVVALKSSVHFRADFEPIAKEVLVVKAPGPALADPAEFPWKKLRKGVRLHPLGPVHA